MTILDTARTVDCDLYADELNTEWMQCTEEGMDVHTVKALFRAAAELPRGELKSRIADALFQWTQTAPTIADYPFDEPSTLSQIRALRLPFTPNRTRFPSDTELLMTGNYPLHRYPLSAEMTDDVHKAIGFDLLNKPYSDAVDRAPADDDTNYTVLAQHVIEKYGRSFTGADVMDVWLHLQPSSAYFTAEQVAYRNRTAGLLPPYSAAYKNPFREWIGAQIRGDYYGYICPGDPETAAEYAFRDAQISHVKNGIYGEMYISAMLAAAAVTDDVSDVIRCGLAQIPASSRLYARVNDVLDGFWGGVPATDCFAHIHQLYNEHTSYGWCHTIPNAMIVTASLLYGAGDFGKSICMAVQAAFDTDCNGATVGSVFGMMYGIDAIAPAWYAPFHGKLDTELLNRNTVDIESLVKETIKHIKEVKQ